MTKEEKEQKLKEILADMNDLLQKMIEHMPKNETKKEEKKNE